MLAEMAGVEDLYNWLRGITMTIPKHKVFISYHHLNDQAYKESLLEWNKNNNYDIFIDASVDTGDIDDNLSDASIREKIRDEYLSDSTVTILLVGTETKNRKHVDWEIYSSMYDGQVNKKSGVRRWEKLYDAGIVPGPVG